MRTLAKSEDDPDEMPHHVAFHQGLHCLHRLSQSSKKEIQFYLEIVTCDPSIFIMDYHGFIVSNQREESRVKYLGH